MVATHKFRARATRSGFCTDGGSTHYVLVDERNGGTLELVTLSGPVGPL